MGDKATFVFDKIAGTTSQPKDYQKRVLKKLEKEQALLLYHGTGSGKTLTSLLAAADQDLEASIIGPASLKHNFPKERAKHNVKAKFTYHSYHKPPADPTSTKDKLLVFDEAHNMGRMESARSHYPDVYQGKKELYLTATPIRNNPDELIPIIRGLGVNLPRNRQAFNDAFIEEVKKEPGFWNKHVRHIKPSVTKRAKNLDVLAKALKGKVDYYKPGTKDYPSVSEETIRVEMSKNQYKAYKETMKGNPSLMYKIKRGMAPDKQESKDLNSFLSASRQISNTARGFDLKSKAEDEPKINRMAKEIAKYNKLDKNYRGVSYSNYLKSGVIPLSKRLTKKGISHALFTGKLNSQQKADIVKDYNSGKIKQLLVSGAGAEGLDLNGTKMLQVMEPHWNEPKIHQVKGRAVRFKSHAHLPINERNVKIQHYIATPRKEGIFFKKRPKGTDEYLDMMSDRKTKLNEQFLQKLRTLS